MYSRFRAGSQIAMSAGVQADLVNDSRRQWFFVAARFRAGNHCAAWESPSRTTVVDELVSPKAQVGGVTWSYGR